MKILIAEDNRELQMIISMLMNDWDYDFDIASNGEKAVELATTNEGAYDLCLMDIDMPVMDGLEATKIIRHRIRYFPIIALTGNPKSIDRYKEVGIDDLMSKPYYPSKLYAKISELTVKAVKVHQKQNEIILAEETPMNPEELKELIELKKKGLTKLKIVGVGGTFVVHRNIQNKISYDLIAEGKDLSDFLDRSEKEPGRCHLYKMNLHVTKDLFTPDELEEAILRENEIAVRFDKVSDRKLPK